MVESLGKRIKQLREAAGVSSEAAAEAAGIDPSQVGLIEQGRVAPAISTLIKFARCFGVRVGTLLDGAETLSPVITRNRTASPTGRLSEPDAPSRTHLDYYSLSQGKSERNMEPYIINVHYQPALEGNFQSHEGEEFFYVLEGEVTVHYGRQRYNLEAGDSIYYDSVVPHCISSLREGENARVLAVIYTPY